MIVYSMILFAAAVLFLVMGIELCRGNTKLIHDYHQTNIKESEQKNYCRGIAKGMFVIFAALLISGILALFGKESPLLTVSYIVLGVGIIISIIIFVTAQRKYNGRPL